MSHETDFVGAYGYAAGEPLKIEVYRGEHNIAHVSAHAVQTHGGGGLEVNRGPSGIAVPGDCWEQITADIQPYDRVEVTDSQGVKEAILVDDIRVTTGPALQPDASVALGGHARSAATGAAIAVDRLRGEARAVGGFRAAPILAAGEPGVVGSYRAGFSSRSSPRTGSPATTAASPIPRRRSSPATTRSASPLPPSASSPSSAGGRALRAGARRRRPPARTRPPAWTTRS